MRLGLIGDNIAASKAPLFHMEAGRLIGLDVSYERLVPQDMGRTARQVFAFAQAEGFRGLNITYPYKSLFVDDVSIADPLVRQMGAINTVRFDPDGARGFNTDYSGFVSAFAGLNRPYPGKVCLIGAGGVGKAVAFGLVKLDASVIRCVDLEPAMAEALAASVNALGTDTRFEVWTDATAAASGADGIINCTPLGMDGTGGVPVPAEAMAGASWAFDAVYTPIETQFLKNAAARGLDILSGFELFFGQGVDAWRIFTGLDLDQHALRDIVAASTP